MIRNAAEDALERNSDSLSDHLVDTRLEVLEANWTRFQTDHEIICQENFANLREETYVKHKTYERCQEFYVQTRAALLSNASSKAFDSLTPITRLTSH